MSAQQPVLYYTFQVHHLPMLTLTQADRGVARVVGVVPKGSVILKPASGVNVHTVFNDSGTDLLDIGTTATGDLYATDLSLAGLGFQACDEAVSFYVAADTTITATYAGQNSDGTTGLAQVLIAFIPPDPPQ